MNQIKKINLNINSKKMMKHKRDMKNMKNHYPKLRKKKKNKMKKLNQSITNFKHQ